MTPARDAPDRDALAVRFGISTGLVETFDRLGLLPHEPDGSFGSTAARRLRLLAFAVQRGVPEEQLLDAAGRYGDLLGAFEELVPSAVVDRPRADLLAEVGIDETLLRQVEDVTGRDQREPLTEEDVQALRTARLALDAGLPREALFQLLRVFADTLERLAEAENRIFHDHVHEQFRRDGLSGRELMEATARIGSSVLELVEPTLLYFHRRAWQRAAQHDFLRHLTEDDRPRPSEVGAMPCAVLFADLAGFTPLTAAMGDSAAADVLHRFGALVRRSALEHFGRVVKQIGDAFMLVFDDRRDAVLCGVTLLDACAAEVRFPGLHVGAHAGDVLFRDGDYVGNAVNLAARVASATEPGQFLVTAELLAGLDLPPEITTDPQPARALKGVQEPTPLIAVGSPTTRADRVIDPVCGMALDPDGDAERRTVDGKQWWFCAPPCADAFTSDPTRYQPGAGRRA